MSCARSLLSNFYSFVSFPCSNHVELSGWSDLTAAHVRVLVGMMFPSPTTNHLRRYIPSKRVSGSIVSSLNGCVCARARKKDWDRVGRIDFTQWEGSGRREGKGAMIWGMRSQGPGLRLRCVCSQSAQPVLLFYPSTPLPLSLSFLDGAHITMVRVPGFLTQFEPRFHSERDGRREGTDRSRQASPPAWPCTRCTLLVYVSMCTPRKA